MLIRFGEGLFFMDENLNKNTLYFDVSSFGLAVRYYSKSSKGWRTRSSSFSEKGRGCAAKVVRGLAKAVAGDSEVISLFETLDSPTDSFYFKGALERSYKYYTSELKKKSN